jgi:hypothetical protein
LTPLMTKLTFLATMGEDKSSCGFSSACDTPSLAEVPETKFRRKSEDVVVEEAGENERKSMEAQLFICAQQNMTMLLVLEPGSAARQELIQTMVRPLRKFKKENQC